MFGSARQGLSAAGGEYGFYELGRAADKRRPIGFTRACMSSLCVKCGSWKQAPMARCGCGFRPTRSSLDQAKCYALSSQFRTAPELEALAQRIRSGLSLSFGEDELRLAMTVGNRSAMVTMSFLLFAVLLGLLIGGAVARLPVVALVTIGVAAAFSGVIAFKLLASVDKLVASRKPASDGTDGP